MDPVSITCAVITFATTVNELIKLGQNINASLLKVKLNKINAQQLVDDVMSHIYRIQGFIRQNGLEVVALETYENQEFVLALKSFEASIRQILEEINYLSSHSGAYRTFIKRNEIEQNIEKLRKDITTHMGVFSTYSSMRTEHIVIDIHQNVSQLSSMVANIHLKQFQKDSRTTGDSKAVSTRSKAAYTTGADNEDNRDIVKQLDALIHALNCLRPSTSSGKSPHISYHSHQSESERIYHHDHIHRMNRYDTTTLVAQIHQKMRRKSLGKADIAYDLSMLALAVRDLDMLEYSVKFNTWAIKFYESLPSVCPSLVDALINLAMTYQDMDDEHEDIPQYPHYLGHALSTSEKAVQVLQAVCDSFPEVDHSLLHASVLLRRGISLFRMCMTTSVETADMARKLEHPLDDLSVAAQIYRELLDGVLTRGVGQDWDAGEVEDLIFDASEAYSGVSACLSSMGRLIDSYGAAQQAFEILQLLPSTEHESHRDVEFIDAALFKCLSRIQVEAPEQLTYERMLAIISAFHRVTMKQPALLGFFFLRLIYSYACLCRLGPSRFEGEYSREKAVFHSLRYMEAQDMEFPVLPTEFSRFLAENPSMTTDILHLYFLHYHPSYNESYIPTLIYLIFANHMEKGLQSLEMTKDTICRMQMDGIDWEKVEEVMDRLHGFDNTIHNGEYIDRRVWNQLRARGDDKTLSSAILSASAGIIKFLDTATESYPEIMYPIILQEYAKLLVQNNWHQEGLEQIEKALKIFRDGNFSLDQCVGDSDSSVQDRIAELEGNRSFIILGMGNLESRRQLAMNRS